MEEGNLVNRTKSVRIVDSKKSKKTKFYNSNDSSSSSNKPKIFTKRVITSTKSNKLEDSRSGIFYSENNNNYSKEEESDEEVQESNSLVITNQNNYIILPTTNNFIVYHGIEFGPNALTISTKDILSNDNNTIIENEMLSRYSMIDSVFVVQDKDIAERKHKMMIEYDRTLDVNDLLINNDIIKQKRKQINLEKRAFQKKEQNEMLALLKNSTKNAVFRQLFELWWSNFIIVGEDYSIVTGFLYRDIEAFAMQFKITYNMFIDIPNHNDFIHDYIKTYKGIECKQLQIEKLRHTYAIGITLVNFLDQSIQEQEVKRITNTSELEKKIEELTQCVSLLMIKVENYNKELKEYKKYTELLEYRLDNSSPKIFGNEEEQDKIKDEEDKSKPIIVKRIVKVDLEKRKKRDRFYYLRNKLKDNGELSSKELVEYQGLLELYGK